MSIVIFRSGSSMQAFYSPGRTMCRRTLRHRLADPFAYPPSRLLPGFAELFSVEEPEDTADENQDGLVDWAGDRESPERGSPSERPQDAAVPHDDRHGPDRFTDERTEAKHSASTVSRRVTRVSRDVEWAGRERRYRRQCGAPQAGLQRPSPPRR